MKCKICSSETKIFGAAIVLNKYNVNYYRCEFCGFMQTEEPYWLDEAYSSAITKSDIGLLSRNISLSNKTEQFILGCLEPNLNYVDYGGGYGIFTRLMRDKGFNFFQFDPKCQNIFAEDFEAEPTKQYSLLTAWEVFEHLVNPLSDFQEMYNLSHTIYFSTTLLPSKPYPLNEWWYYGLEHGQHISFFTKKSIEILCQKFNLSVLFSDNSIHLISDQAIDAPRLKICFDDRYKILRSFINKPKPQSLINDDFEKITGIKLS